MPSCPGFAPPFPFWLVGLFPACLGHRVPRWSLRSDGPHPAHPIPAARWHGKARSLRSDGFRSLLHVLTSPCTMVVSPERAVPRRSRVVVTTQLAPRLPAAVGSTASEVMMLGSGEFVMLLLRCCLLLMLRLLMLLLLLRPRGRTLWCQDTLWDFSPTDL